MNSGEAMLFSRQEWRNLFVDNGADDGDDRSPAHVNADHAPFREAIAASFLRMAPIRA